MNDSRLVSIKQRIFIGFFICFSFVLSIAHSVSADNYDVSATVPAELPSGKPSITSPKNGTVLTQTSVVVAGECPTASPAVVVVIYENDTILGSTSCSVDGTFSATVTLTSGNHQLRAAIVTITGQSGEVSQEVVVTVTLPVSPRAPSAGSPNRNQVNSVTLEPLVLNTSQQYLLLNSEKTVEWKGAIEEGLPPYSMNIDWGDGKIDNYSIADNSLQTFRHTYETFDTFSIVITFTDSQGRKGKFTTTAVSVRQKKTLQSTVPIVSKIQPTPMSGIEKYATGFGLLGILAIAIGLWVRYKKNKKIRDLH